MRWRKDKYGNGASERKLATEAHRLGAELVTMGDRLDTFLVRLQGEVDRLQKAPDKPRREGS